MKTKKEVMNRGIMILIVITLLFAISLSVTVTSQTEINGCCCNFAEGTTQDVESYRLESECNPPYTDFAVPQLLDIIEGKGCAEICSELYTPPETPPPPPPPPETPAEFCGPGFYPSVTDLTILPDKGEKVMRLEWSEECRADSYIISRCEGTEEQCANYTQIAIIPNTIIYRDMDEELLFDQDYTYKVVSVYGLTQSEPAIETGNLGDIECWNQFTTEPVCIFSLYYTNYQTYLKENGYADKDGIDFLLDFDYYVQQVFFNKFNRPARCDNANRLTLLEEACLDGEMCFIDEVEGSPTPACIEGTPCDTFSSLFGLSITQEQCEGGEGNRHYCFYDKSKSILNKCYNCDPRMTCYDYRSKDACEANNCNIGQCEWQDTYPSLGIGVCKDKKISNCYLCDLQGSEYSPTYDVYNLVFDQCSQEKAQAMSTEEKPCFWNNWKAAGCEAVSCADYTVTQCKGSSSGVQLAADNSILDVSKSTDPCGIEVCQYDLLTGCRKNADGTAKTENWPDCTKGDKTCELDYFSPETTIVPTGDQGRYDYLNVRIFDKVNYTDPGTVIGKAGTLETEEGGEYGGRGEYPYYRVYLCLETNTTPCENAADFTVSINSTQMNLNDLILQDGTRKLFDLQFGKNVLKYYAVDKYKNHEVIKSMNIFACENCQGPKVDSIDVEGALEVDGVFYTTVIKPTIDISLTELAELTASRIVTPEGETILFDVEPNPVGNLYTEYTLEPKDNMVEGTNLFEFNAKDDNQVFINNPPKIDIVYDVTAPLATIYPYADAVLGNDTVDITIEFNEPVRDDYKIELWQELVRNGVLVLKKFDITNATQTSDNRVFTASVVLEDGKKTIVATVKDYAGNDAFITQDFYVNAGPPVIYIIQPSFGYSPSKTFDLEFGTDSVAECKYWTSQTLPPAPFADLIPFERTNDRTHFTSSFTGPTSDTEPYKVYVECIDPDFGSSGSTFELFVDSTPPHILNAYAQPSLIVEEPYTTNFKISTDDKTRCRYIEGIYNVVLGGAGALPNQTETNTTSNTTTPSGTINFADMPGEFPGFNEFGKTAHIAPVTLEESRLHKFTLACVNLAELGPVSTQIQVDVDTSRGFIATNVGPKAFNSTLVYLGVETNKNAYCYYTFEGKQNAFEKDQIPTKAHNIEFQVAADGEYTIPVNCVTGAKTTPTGPEETQITITLFVDTTPPIMTYVDDSSILPNKTDISYFTDRLRVAFLANDTETKVTRYYYAVENLYTLQTVKNWTATTTLTGQPHYIMGLALLDTESYLVKVKAQNAVGLKSDELASDGVTIDVSLKPPQCSNLQWDANETDIDCGGICPGCQAGQNCSANIDCESGICAAGKCAEPSCDDSMQNGDETGEDCGGSCDIGCANGESCLEDTDCQSGHCINGACGVPDACNNGELNGEESDIDCGGACSACGKGKSCTTVDDCQAPLECIQNTCAECQDGDADCDGIIDDLDGDGILNENDVCPNTPSNEDADETGCSECQKDTDKDQMPDCWEDKYGLDKNDPTDAQQDADGDKLTNLKEYRLGTDPTNSDTDGDKWKDGKEVDKGTDPTDPYDHPKSMLPLILLLLFLLIGIVLGAIFGRKYIKKIIQNKKIPLKPMDIGKKLPKKPIKGVKPSDLKNAPKKPEDSNIKQKDWVPLYALGKHVDSEKAGDELFSKLKQLRKGNLGADEHGRLLKEVKKNPETKEVFDSLKELHEKSLDKEKTIEEKEKEQKASSLFGALKNLGEKKEVVIKPEIKVEVKMKQPKVKSLGEKHPPAEEIFKGLKDLVGDKEKGKEQENKKKTKSKKKRKKPKRRSSAQVVKDETKKALEKIKQEKEKAVSEVKEHKEKAKKEIRKKNKSKNNKKKK